MFLTFFGKSQVIWSGFMSHLQIQFIDETLIFFVWARGVHMVYFGPCCVSNLIAKTAIKKKLKKHIFHEKNY